MVVNKTRDLIERVGWTFIQAFVGTLIALNLTGDVAWSEVLYSAAVAGGISAGKVIIAQQFVGTNGAGDLLPGAPTTEEK